MLKLNYYNVEKLEMVKRKIKKRELKLNNNRKHQT